MEDSGEPFHYSPACNPDDIICAGSDTEETFEETQEKRLRYEYHAQRILQGHLPVLESARLRGPLTVESGWINPWRHRPRKREDWWQPSSSRMLFTRENVMERAAKFGLGHLSAADALAWCKASANIVADETMMDETTIASVKEYQLEIQGGASCDEEVEIGRSYEPTGRSFNSTMNDPMGSESRLPASSIERPISSASMGRRKASTPMAEEHELARTKRRMDTQWLKGSYVSKRARWDAPSVPTPTPMIALTSKADRRHLLKTPPVPENTQKNEPRKRMSGFPDIIRPGPKEDHARRNTTTPSAQMFNSSFPMYSNLRNSTFVEGEYTVHITGNEHEEFSPMNISAEENNPRSYSTKLRRRNSFKDNLQNAAFESKRVEENEITPRAEHGETHSSPASSRSNRLPTLLPNSTPHHPTKAGLIGNEDCSFVTEVAPSSHYVDKFQYRKKRSKNERDSDARQPGQSTRQSPQLNSSRRNSNQPTSSTNSILMLKITPVIVQAVPAAKTSEFPSDDSDLEWDTILSSPNQTSSTKKSQRQEKHLNSADNSTDAHPQEPSEHMDDDSDSEWVTINDINHQSSTPGDPVVGQNRPFGARIESSVKVTPTRILSNQETKSSSRSRQEADLQSAYSPSPSHQSLPELLTTNQRPTLHRGNSNPPRSTYPDDSSTLSFATTPVKSLRTPAMSSQKTQSTNGKQNQLGPHEPSRDPSSDIVGGETSSQAGSRPIGKAFLEDLSESDSEVSPLEASSEMDIEDDDTLNPGEKSAGSQVALVTSSTEPAEIIDMDIDQDLVDEQLKATSQSQRTTEDSNNVVEPEEVAEGEEFVVSQRSQPSPRADKKVGPGDKLDVPLVEECQDEKSTKAIPPRSEKTPPDQRTASRGDSQKIWKNDMTQSPWGAECIAPIPVLALPGENYPGGADTPKIITSKDALRTLDVASPQVQSRLNFSSRPSYCSPTNGDDFLKPLSTLGSPTLSSRPRGRRIELNSPMNTQVLVEAATKNPWASSVRKAFSGRPKKRVSFGGDFRNQDLTSQSAKSPSEHKLPTTPPPVSNDDDNFEESPESSQTFAKRFVIGGESRRFLRQDITSASNSSPALDAQAEAFIAADKEALSGSGAKLKSLLKTPTRQPEHMTHDSNILDPWRTDSTPDSAKDRHPGLANFDMDDALGVAGNFLEEWSVESEMESVAKRPPEPSTSTRRESTGFRRRKLFGLA